MSMKMKYAIATIATIFVSYYTIFDNILPEWYWMSICLSSIWGTFCFGIAEKVYKTKLNWTYKDYPMSFIGSGITVISGILAIIQIILIVRNDL